jgi:hypothetical protein
MISATAVISFILKALFLIHLWFNIKYNGSCDPKLVSLSYIQERAFLLENLIVHG